MRTITQWFKRNYLYLVLVGLLLLGIYDVFLRIDNNKLKEQNAELREKVAALEVENEDQFNTIIERNNEIYRLQMMADEWKELFYAEIDFHPYEGPDW